MERIDLLGLSCDEARAVVRDALKADKANAGAVYAALCHLVWGMLSERRTDGNLRDWHGLLLGTRAFILSEQPAVAERLSALADLLRESITLAETLPAKQMLASPRIGKTLRLLRANGGAMERRKLREAIGAKEALMSNMLAKIAAAGLVEREQRGKEAVYRLTKLGDEIVPAPAGKAPPMDCWPSDWRELLSAPPIPSEVRCGPWVGRGSTLYWEPLPKAKIVGRWPHIAVARPVLNLDQMT